MHQITFPNPNRPRRQDRLGGILLEVAVSCGLLIMILAAVAQTSVAFLRQQRAASTRDIAAQEAANLLDLSHRIPYQSLTADSLNQTLQSDSSLMDSTTWSVTELTTEGVRTKRVLVTLHWRIEGQDYSLPLMMWRSAPVPSDGKEAGE